jgi:hypothetical protein
MQCRFDPPDGQAGEAVTECVTVIAPFEGAAAPELSMTAETWYPSVRQVDIRWADGRQDRIVYTGRLAQPIREFGGLNRRAVLLVADGDGAVVGEVF